MSADFLRLRRHKDSLLLLCVLAMWTAFQPSPALGAVHANDPEALVNIPDSALREAVERQLGKTSGEPITRGEMETITWLSADGSVGPTGRAGTRGQC